MIDSAMVFPPSISHMPPFWLEGKRDPVAMSPRIDSSCYSTFQSGSREFIENSLSTRFLIL